MSIVQKDSVRFQVTFAVLVTISLSWIISTGLANYMNYMSVRAIRQEMLTHPNLYPNPIPEPRFSIMDFLIGRPPRSFGEGPRMFAPEGRPGMQPGFRMGQGFPGGPMAGPRGPQAGPQRPEAGPMPLDHGPDNAGSPPPFFTPLELRWVLIRLAVALALALLAGAWVGRKLTKPVTELAAGAKAFQERRFDYRISTSGKNEFTAVATAMNDMADEVSGHITSLKEDADRRRQFLADIAHELRSPITTIRTMAGALQDGVAEEPERKERAVSVLVRTSERMMRLVQDVMELVELDLDKLPINREMIDLGELVASVVTSFDAEAAKAGIKLQPFEPKEKITASVDPDRITQVLDNIIGNAISYAGTGASVSVSIEGQDPIKITVTDTGVGIPAKDLPEILNPFYRVDAARTPGENHIGLGLSIARRMVEAHGGRISISSTEGKGTSVTIALPRS